MGASRGTVEERVWRHVEVRGLNECWPWTGSLNPSGHGQLAVPKGWYDNAYKRPWTAHRVVWVVEHGCLPKGQIDHTCHNESDCEGGSDCPHRKCCNPAHLEDVSAKVNKARGKSRNAVNARKTRCHRGHEFTPENTRVRENGNRGCRTCDRMFAAISNAAKKERGGSHGP